MSGTGAFTQTGGTHTVTTELNIGTESGSSGTLNLSGTGSLSTDFEQIGLSGTGIFNQSGGTNTVTNDLIIAEDGGNGIYNVSGGNLSITDTILAPGNSPGITSVFGDYSQDINSTLQIELGGLTAGTEYDVLDVTGMMSLGGTLEVLLYGGFDPLVGNTFDILNWGSLTGMFDFLVMPTLMGDLFWDTSSLYTTGELSVGTVPEPATVALLGLGLAGLGGMYMRRRRKQNTVDCMQ